MRNQVGSEDHAPRRRLGVLMRSMLTALASLAAFKRRALASVASVGVKEGASVSPIQGMVLWAALFLLSAGLHSAESAITKISPWKIQEFAEEEGPGSPFATLSQNITRLLSTILITSTTCSIYSTALFVTSISALFPALGLGSITIALTAITLFFGELLPKALAVANSELVARRLVPFLSRLSAVMLPATSLMTLLSNAVLVRFGMRLVEDKNVSEEMVRRVVAEAQATAGIESLEGKMIQAVLDLQEQSVNKVMVHSPCYDRALLLDMI